MADSAALLVDDILPHQPMRQWVLSFPFPLRFLFASNPKAMTGVLGIIYRAISTHLTHKAGLKKPMAQTGAVTLIQRFGSALNLNIHFHMLFLDGAYSSNGHPNRFRQVKAPSRTELTRLTHTIAQRAGRYLERQGLVERDTGNIFLAQDAVTPTKRGKRKKLLSADGTDHTPAEKRASMTWAKRLKRVFNIDVETCDKWPRRHCCQIAELHRACRCQHR